MVLNTSLINTIQVSIQYFCSEQASKRRSFSCPQVNRELLIRDGYEILLRLLDNIFPLTAIY